MYLVSFMEQSQSRWVSNVWAWLTVRVTLYYVIWLRFACKLAKHTQTHVHGTHAYSCVVKQNYSYMSYALVFLFHLIILTYWIGFMTHWWFALGSFSPFSHGPNTCTLVALVAGAELAPFHTVMIYPLFSWDLGAPERPPAGNTLASKASALI